MKIEELREQLKSGEFQGVHEELKRCILCGNPSIYVGLFIPPAGSSVIVYGLCRLHEPNEMVAQAVEDTINELGKGV